jgi:hypothetical protein
MSETIPNLWPDDFGKPPPTPLGILRQQGVYLGQRTNNLVIGEVRSLAGADFLRHFFELSAPLLGYRYTLFSIEHDPITLYPVEFKGKGSLGRDGKAANPEQFLQKLHDILSSEETRMAVQALIAQSQA